MSALPATLIAGLLGCGLLTAVRPNLWLARAAALLTLLVTSVLGAYGLSPSGVPGASLLGVDELSALFLPLSALIACAVLWGAPARELGPRSAASVLLSLAASIAALCARDLWMFTAAWIGSLAASALGLSATVALLRMRRAFLRYATLGTLPLLIALALTYPHGGASFAAHARGLDSGPTQHLVFTALAIAAAFRSGLFPLHSWLPALTERAPIAVSAPLFGAPLGALLVARAIVPLTPSVAASDLATLATWAALAALYPALLGLAQQNLKRALGFVLTSQSALLLFGVSGADHESMHGALLGLLASGLCAAGLLLVAAQLEARTGSADLALLRGEGRRLPRMTALFFLFGAAAIGLPGSLSYVSEDLLLHGLLRSNPRGALALLIVTVLNGINVLRLFFTIFLGPSRARHAPRLGDLTRGEGLVAASLLVLSFAAGLAPRPLIALQAHSVRALAQAAGASSTHTQPTH